MLYPAELWVLCKKACFPAGLANVWRGGCQAFAGTKRQNAAQRGTMMAQFTAQWVKGAALSSVLAFVQCSSPAPDAQAQAVPAATPCRAAYVIDGDTIACATGPRIRLASIDAPELPGHCRTGRRCVGRLSPCAKEGILT